MEQFPEYFKRVVSPRKPHKDTQSSNQQSTNAKNYRPKSSPKKIRQSEDPMTEDSNQNQQLYQKV